MAVKSKSKRNVTDETKSAETKSEKFARLAQQRVGRALKMIYNIGNLGGAGYESTLEQRQKIADALNSAVENTLSRLNKETVKPTGFSL